MLIRISRFATSLLAAILVVACAAPPPSSSPSPLNLADLADADAVLLGERHDAPEHHLIERNVVAALAARGTLAALTLEMAERGTTTAALPAQAPEAQVRQALAWNEELWPWADYGPVAMAAVRAGVPVLGANLPRAQMGASMADASLDMQLPGPVLKAQQQAIRIGHCDQLPESRISPMTRIQIARDRAMAQTVQQSLQPGNVVVLVSGAGHADRALGVPQHLPREVRVKAVKLQAGPAAPDRASRFDAVWHTPALPETDYCAGLGRAK